MTEQHHFITPSQYQTLDRIAIQLEALGTAVAVIARSENTNKERDVLAVLGDIIKEKADQLTDGLSGLSLEA